ncbi:TPA: TetR/AcrR family transcriptional regulator [Photobacterium damselae]
MKTRDRIILASRELFNKQGESNVTTNHIAAHLGISPGNLYYHFRNKEEIIHCIFDEYAQELSVRFQPQNMDESSDGLLGYLDGVFFLMWRYRFFYANLPDILRRDEVLQVKYLTAQEQLHYNIARLMQNFRQMGLVNLNDEDLQALADTLKLVASSWISYQTTQAPGAKITKKVIYHGVIQMLNIVRPLATEKGRERVEQLREYYNSQQQEHQ